MICLRVSLSSLESIHPFTIVSPLAYLAISPPGWCASTARSMRSCACAMRIADALRASCRHVHAPAPGHSPHPQATAHDTGQPRAASGLTCVLPGAWSRGVRRLLVCFRLHSTRNIGVRFAPILQYRNKKPRYVRVKVTTVDYYK